MKMTKRLGLLLLAALLVCSLMPATGLAVENTDQTCGENAFWHFEDGTLTVTGTGAMTNYRVPGGGSDGEDLLLPQPWSVFSQDIRHIILAEGITSVGWDAFARLPNLESVKLPDSLTEIGCFAFWECPSLSEINLPEGLTGIGQEAFAGTALRSVEIPASVTFMDAGIFSRCALLTEVLIRSDPELPMFSCGNSVFRNCASLESIRVENGHMALTSMDGALYYIWDQGERFSLSDYPAGKQDTRVRLADKTFCMDQFSIDSNPYLQTLILPATLTEIGNCGLCRCENLQDVIFEGDAPAVASAPFFCCNITIHYPCGNASWEEARNSWDPAVVAPGGSIAWASYHTYDGGAVTKEPTANEPGIRTYTCTGCGATKTEQIPVLPAHTHSFGGWIIDTEAVPGGAEGTKHRDCACGQRETAFYTTPLTDVPNGKYFSKPIFWAYENGITKGKTANEFQKDLPCTRKQIVTFLWRAAGQPEPESMENPFVDVTRGDQFEKAILWAYYSGITKGTDETHFSPENPCTRKQIVMFLWRFNDKPDPESTDNPFDDVKRGDQFEKAILWALGEGITKGKTATTFEPEEPCTRGQIVTFLYRSIAEE